jgi:hypothetical protein
LLLITFRRLALSPHASTQSKKLLLGRLMSGMHRKAMFGTTNPFQVKMAVIKAHDPGFILTDPAAPDSWGVQVFR